MSSVRRYRQCYSSAQFVLDAIRSNAVWTGPAESVYLRASYLPLIMPASIPASTESTAKATLLLFTLGAAAETERRRLLPAPCRAEEHALHRACIDNALSAGREAQCRLVVSSPAALDLAPDALLIEQQGQGFGQRLSLAMRNAFDRSGPVIVVGGDSPELGAEHVSTAIDRLNRCQADVVLGPCPDGGLYLLGARKPLTGLLESVRWCRPNTLADLVRRLEAEGLRIAYLAPLGDLDRSRDLDRWLAKGDTRRFGHRLLILISAALGAHRQPLITDRFHPLAADPVRHLRGRAPPRAA